MTKVLGEKLAGGVRQAKEKQTQKNKPDTKIESKPDLRPPIPEKELPLPVLPSKRVWPD